MGSRTHLAADPRRVESDRGDRGLPSMAVASPLLERTPRARGGGCARGQRHVGVCAGGAAAGARAQAPLAFRKHSCGVRATPHSAGSRKPLERAAHASAEIRVGSALQAGRTSSSGLAGKTSSAFPSQLKSAVKTPGPQLAGTVPVSVLPGKTVAEETAGAAAAGQMFSQQSLTPRSGTYGISPSARHVNATSGGGVLENELSPQI